MDLHVNSILDSITYRLGPFLIDPGDEWDGFLNVGAVLLTHVHFDHIFGINRVIELNPDIPVYTNIFGKKALTDPKLNLSKYHSDPFIFQYPENIRLLSDGQTLTLEDVTLTAYETPGHNPSCITFVNDTDIFTGDALIPGMRTVTYLPFNDKTKAAESEQRIQTLSQGRIIRPGHRSV